MDSNEWVYLACVFTGFMIGTVLTVLFFLFIGL